MRKVVLLLVAALGAQASITLVSDTAASNNGITGTGSYGNGVTVAYALDLYEREEVGQAGLSQPIYYRYRYEFSTTPGQALAAQAAAQNNTDAGHLIVALPWDCESDSECVFGLIVQGAPTSYDQVMLHTDTGAVDPIFGMRIDNLGLGVRPLSLSFFSNRIPDGNGRVYMKRGQDHLVSDPGVVITPNSAVLPQASEAPGDALDAVPEPMSVVLLGSGLALFVALRRRP